MASTGRILAGFVKGASEYGVDLLEERRKEESDIRKARLLEQLRMDTQKELAQFEEALAMKRGDKNFSGVDNGQFVTRNNRGEEIGRRALSASEAAELDDERRKRSLDIRNIESQISSRSRDDARQDRLAASQIAENTARARSLSLDGGGSSSPTLTNQNSLAQGLVARYKDLLGAGDEKLDELDAFDLANEAIEYAKQTNGKTADVERYFLQKLRERRGKTGVQFVE